MIKAMKQALEALEMYLTLDTPEEANMLETYIAPRAYAALKQAIEQAEEEPKCAAIIEVYGKDWRLDYMSLPVGRHKLYTQQYVYTTPPKPEWVGLTDEEINEAQEVAYRSFRRYEMSTRGQLIMPADSVDWHFAQAVEAKLKEKNHG